MKPGEPFELLTRNCSEVISSEEFRRKLDGASVSGKPLRIKAGFDPSAPDIHLGHTVLLTKLRQFQDLGHEVIFIIGDMTARIGDPSGRSQTRPVLDEKQVQENARTYQEQAFKILDPKKTHVVFNGEWFSKFKLEEVMGLVSRVTVSQILEREDFQKRLNAGHPVSMMEMFYPLMQAYDSVHLRADVELGGTDQKFNLLLGRELQRNFGQEPQVVLTLPLLVGLDGKQKMSKSYKNHIGVTDASSDMFGKVMSIPDDAMIEYYRLLTDKDANVIKRGIQDGSLHPKTAKEDLATIITERFCGAKQAEEARSEFSRVFSQKENPADAPLFTFEPGERKIVKLIQDCGCAQSASEARRLVVQNAVSVDGKPVSDPNGTCDVSGSEKVLKVGKRRFARFKAF